MEVLLDLFSWYVFIGIIFGVYSWIKRTSPARQSPLERRRQAAVYGLSWPVFAVKKVQHITAERRAPSPSDTGRLDVLSELQYDWSAKADPADIENVHAEWDMSNLDYQEPRAWGNGMRLYEAGPPGQRFNSVEYMSRGFCHVLFDPNFMDDDSVAITIERMLIVFDEGKISSDIEAIIAARCIRLALAVMRERCWQPTALGGTNRMNINLDTPRIRASLSCAGISSDKSLEHFFGLT
jgi:hypothetical protein